MGNTYEAPKSGCVIVGAGMAGLTAGHILKDQNIRVTVLDKGRGIGGRMATRRIHRENAPPAVFDYGAQYFTARDSRFQKQVDTWIRERLLRVWGDGFETHTGAVKKDGEARYIGRESIRAIATHLSHELDVHAKTHVNRLARKGDVWRVHTETGLCFESEAVLLTPPVPQTLDLLHRSEIALPTDAQKALKRITYHPCIAVLALLDGVSSVPGPGGVWGDGNPLVWMADNRQKGVSPGASAVTLHAGPDFSRAYWDRPDAEVTERLVAAAAPWLGAPVMHYQVHRWRYSLPTTSFPDPCFYHDQPGSLALAGDAFMSGRIEGAFLSGLAAGERLVSTLT